MQASQPQGRRMILLPVLLLLLVVGGVDRAHAGAAKCYGPYTLNSVNYAPSTTGDDVTDWTGDFTVNMSVDSGSLSVNVEAKLDGGTFASLGTVTASTNAQFHGPFHKLRFNVTACSSCLATIIACAAKGD